MSSPAWYTIESALSVEPLYLRRAPPERENLALRKRMRAAAYLTVSRDAPPAAARSARLAARAAPRAAESGGGGGRRTGSCANRGEAARTLGRAIERTVTARCTTARRGMCGRGR